MQTAFIAVPHVQTAVTGRGESLADLLAVLAPASSSKKHLLQMEQIHGAESAVVDERFDLETLTAQSPADTSRLSGVDAVLTSLPNLTLEVRTADCAPILLAHPSGIIGVIHAGRNGTEQKILQKTLNLLKETWNITDDLHIWIGPHICAECYEINRQTSEHYDLLTENLKQLHAEFAPETISLTLDGRCTAHHNGKLYSYRKEGAGVPMNYSGITAK